MKKIAFATRKIAEDYIATFYPGAEKELTEFDFDDSFDDDDSMYYIGQRSGTGSGYEVSEGGKTTLQAVWWEEGAPYQIRKNGEVVETVTYWGLAMHRMKELAAEEEKIAQEKEYEGEDYTIADIDCICDDFGLVNVKNL